MTGEYMHILDAQGKCSCGTFSANLEDPQFSRLAANHFTESHVVAVRHSEAARIALAAIIIAAAAITLVVALAVAVAL